MDDAGVSIPTGSDVPLHVGVVGEEITLGTERDVVCVSESTGDEFIPGAVEIGSNHIAGRRHPAHGVSARIPQPFQQYVLVGMLERRVASQAFRRPNMVSMDEVERLAVGSQCNGVGTVLATPVPGGELFMHLERSIAIDIPKPVQSTAFGQWGVHVAVDVAMVEQPLDALDRASIRSTSARRHGCEDGHRPALGAMTTRPASSSSRPRSLHPLRPGVPVPPRSRRER